MNWFSKWIVNGRSLASVWSWNNHWVKGNSPGWSALPSVPQRPSQVIAALDSSSVASSNDTHWYRQGHRVVAVKMAKSRGGTREELNDLISEFHLLKDVDHSNVVKLLGACSDPDGPFLLILEHCEFGSLLLYLRGLQRAAPDAMAPPRQILSFAWQISQAMAYLTQLKVLFLFLLHFSLFITLSIYYIGYHHFLNQFDYIISINNQYFIHISSTFHPHFIHISSIFYLYHINFTSILIYNIWTYYVISIISIV